jgi:hypothetical protein
MSLKLQLASAVAMDLVLTHGQKKFTRLGL